MKNNSGLYYELSLLRGLLFYSRFSWTLMMVCTPYYELI